VGGPSPYVSQQRKRVATHHPTMYKDKAQQIADLLDLKGEDYSSPDNFFIQLANAWSGLLGIELTPSQCCAMMIVFKSCRIMNNPEHQDTADDLVGYSLIMTDLVKILEEHE
jgi:hypothetical protein